MSQWLKREASISCKRDRRGLGDGDTLGEVSLVQWLEEVFRKCPFPAGMEEENERREGSF